MKLLKFLSILVIVLALFEYTELKSTNAESNEWGFKNKLKSKLKGIKTKISKPKKANAFKSCSNEERRYAALYAHLADISYNPDQIVQLSKFDFKIFKIIEIPRKNSSAIVLYSQLRKNIVVAIRGTQPTSYKNKTDLLFKAIFTKGSLIKLEFIKVLFLTVSL